MNKNSIDSSLLSLIESRRDLIEKLELIELYGILRSSSGGKPFDAVGLESDIAEKLAIEFSRYHLESENSEKSAGVVVTELFHSGGHTPLLLNIMKALDNWKFEVFHTSGKIFQLEAPNVKSTKINYPSTLNRIEKILNLANQLQRFSTIFIAIAPHDIEAAVAVRLAKGKRPSLKVFIINHADHVFNFGLMSESTSLEISSYGYYINKQRSGPSTSSFIGIPLKKTKEDKERAMPTDGCISIISSGSSFKFQPANGMNYPLVIFEILQQNRRATFTAIGPNIVIDWWWWKLLIHFPSRARIVKRLPHKEYLELIKTAHIYIDSFPCTGGTAYSEAYFQNLICLGLVPSIYGYSPLDDFRVPDEKTLIRYVGDLIQNKIDSSSINPLSAKRKIVQETSFEAFKARLMHTLSGRTIQQPNTENYTPEILYLGTRFGGWLFYRWALNCSMQNFRSIAIVLIKNMKKIRIIDIGVFLYAGLRRCI